MLSVRSPVFPLSRYSREITAKVEQFYPLFMPTMLPYTCLNERHSATRPTYKCGNNSEYLPRCGIPPRGIPPLPGVQQPLRYQLLSLIKFFRGCDAHAGRSIAVLAIQVSQERTDYWSPISRIIAAVYRINLHEISVTIWGAADTWSRRAEYPHRRLCFPLRRSTSARNRNVVIMHWTIP